MTHRDDRCLIAEYLARHNTMTLATCDGVSAWAAAVFYASDTNLTLYFMSDPKTRHMRDISAIPEVAATIHDDGQAWTSIRGLQILGSCSRVSNQELGDVSRCYLEKFPFLNSISEHPENASAKILAERLQNTPFYQLSPSWIRFIDNTRGFGHKAEIRLED